MTSLPEDISYGVLLCICGGGHSAEASHASLQRTRTYVRGMHWTLRTTVWDTDSIYGGSHDVPTLETSGIGTPNIIPLAIRR